MQQQAVYEQILERLTVRIRAYAASRVGADGADEVTQETLLLLHNKYGHVREELEVTKLSLTIANYKCKEYRRGPKHAELDGAKAIDPESRELSPFDQALLEQVKSAIPKLDKECRQIMRLKLLGENYDSMAEMLGRSKNTLYQQCLRCNRRLREMLTGGRRAT